MMKISEVADRLNIETYVVFEALLTHESELAGYVSKKHGVTYLEESGLSILRHIISGQPLPTEPTVEQNHETSSNGDMDSYKVDDTESDDWLTDDDLKVLSAEKSRIRGEIRNMRSELIQLEAEDKRLAEVIQHYMEELEQAAQQSHEVEQSFTRIIRDFMTTYDQDEGSADNRLLSFLKR